MKPTEEQLAKLSQMYNLRRKALLHYRGMLKLIEEKQTPEYERLKKEKDAFLASDNSLLDFMEKEILAFRLEINCPANWSANYVMMFARKVMR